MVGRDLKPVSHLKKIHIEQGFSPSRLPHIIPLLPSSHGSSAASNLACSAHSGARWQYFLRRSLFSSNSIFLSFSICLFPFGERIFLRDFGSSTRYTYQDLEYVTSQLAGALQQLGIQPGERVALLHPNHSDFILGYFAVIKAGAVVVPINPVYTAKEVLYILEDCGVRCLLTTSSFEPLLREIQGQAAHLKEIVIKGDHQSLLQALETRVKGLKPGAVRDRAPDDAALSDRSGLRGH
jgi:AMP-binding enzyme